MQTTNERPVRMALPKGRMLDGVTGILRDAGIQLAASARDYRPQLSIPGYELKLLKPQNIVEMLHVGSRDFGFAGADWVRELGADLVELVDTGLDRVRLVAAAPVQLLQDGALETRGVVVASEYERLTKAWIARRELDATFVRAFGATEVFPPEDADVIVDNTASGATLAANGLEVFDELMTSSTRLYANPDALDDPERRDRIEAFALTVRSVVEARQRVLFEVNVPAARLEEVCRVLPSMDRPTVAQLAGQEAFGVKAAVPRAELPALVAAVKARGGSDIVVSPVSQLVP